MIGDHANMSVVLRSIMDTENGKIAIEKALSTYPLYTPKSKIDLIPSREELNEKILNHYKYREIGFETVGRFLDELKIAMCEIMPYYNELFKTVEIMAALENPFDNVDVTETYEETRTEITTTEGSSTSEQNATTSQESSGSQSAESSGNRSENSENTGSRSAENSRRVSDTPQNNVSNINNYLTEHVVEDATESNSTNGSATVTESAISSTEDSQTASSSSVTDTATTAEGSAETTGSTRHTFNKKGNQGVNTYAHDMIEFRESIVDVVDRIIHDKRIAELFMLVW